ncbi:MAG: hypothetical protein LKE46_14995 [Clostridium sp.]|jgi:hypothetical protein|uniref:hypothetical protein n=1 Tax=Clostridium sp. TaxID=1506 RepID=UPI0025BA9EAE|nr:hypothetical protein [Clostridium sp.]MCH3965541.1 hypothetical protein [Clostridium sp.]MCI1716869.1 hypothetical protein [Clostridium sp.]MCI1801201.1 hypothetical protein [Clostridium sp.]MCI1815055.1 hypothetical protein [Clostridium sp.]MCI1871957.1 hypothetical protein [Clostridium sp.]
MNELTCREKAILTYWILQRRKAGKAKDKENMVFEVVDMAVNRCRKMILLSREERYAAKFFIDISNK